MPVVRRGLRHRQEHGGDLCRFGSPRRAQSRTLVYASSVGGVSGWRPPRTSAERRGLVAFIVLGAAMPWMWKAPWRWGRRDALTAFGFVGVLVVASLLPEPAQSRLRAVGAWFGLATDGAPSEVAEPPVA
jgi:hypothetical protein